MPRRFAKWPRGAGRVARLPPTATGKENPEPDERRAPWNALGALFREHQPELIALGAPCPGDPLPWQLGSAHHRTQSKSRPAMFWSAAPPADLCNCGGVREGLYPGQC
jgi:hypothetical protein